jgi:transposase InsO family protein
MCGKKELFDVFNEEFKDSVKLGNDASLQVQGKGSIRMEIDGIMHVITEVFYVPDLKNNLLSIGQLQEKGFAVLMQHGTCKIFHPNRGLIIETAMSHNRMFILIAKYESKEQKCFVSLITDQSHLWHCRYGHLGWTGLQVLQHKKMVEGMPQQFSIPSKVCEDCFVGKQRRDPFPKVSTWRASSILQLVHADICGPINPMSTSKKRYLLTFIDDFSRKTWVYFLVEKSEAFVVFKHYKAKVEKEAEACIKALRTDHGGEFTSQDFTNFCGVNGIRRQLTAAYTPQQNGIAERKNQTIMNMVRCMLSGKQVPNTFWPEAVNWTVHILNRSPTFAVRSKTPEEAWSGIKPSVSHFRVFGCISHVHVPDNRRVKLDNKSRKCIFFGVSDESKVYRLFDPISHKIIISRDVVFEEDQRWDWEVCYNKEIVSDLVWEQDEGEGTGVGANEEESEANSTEESEGSETTDHVLQLKTKKWIMLIIVLLLLRMTHLMRKLMRTHLMISNHEDHQYGCKTTKVDKVSLRKKSPTLLIWHCLLTVIQFFLKMQ